MQDRLKPRKQDMIIMAESGSTQHTGSDFEALIHSSIRRYEEILALFTTINGVGGDTRPVTLEAAGTELLHLQEQAALADRDLINALQERTTFDGSEKPLIARRLAIIQQILQHNRLLLTTVGNIKSLLAHEIKQAQGGQAALSGYRQTNLLQNGGILRGSL